MSDLALKLSPYMQVKKYAKGEFVSLDLAAAASVMVVESGLCIVETSRECTKAKGKYTSVGVLKAEGMLVGLEFFFIDKGETPYIMTVKAVTDCVVRSISKQKLAGLLVNDLKPVSLVIYQELARHLAEYHHQLQSRIESQTKNAPEDRAWDTFLSIKDLVGVPHAAGVEIRLPSDVLQSLMGDSARSFAEGTTRLMRDGKLVRSGRSGWVLLNEK